MSKNAIPSPRPQEVRGYYTITAFLGWLRAGEYGRFLAVQNIAYEDFEQVISSSPWVSTDESVLKATLDSIMVGACRFMRLEPVRLPAEYVAAVLSIFVHPGNLMSACQMYNGQPPLSVLADERDATATVQGYGLSGDQLFALAIQYAGAEVAFSRDDVVKQVGDALRANQPPGKDGKRVEAGSEVA